MRLAAGATGAGGALSALAAAGWLGAIVLIAGIAVLASVACWVVNDNGRAQRLALIIRTWRAQPARTSSRGPGDRA